MLQPRHPATIAIERGFRRLAHGDVHYRAAGDGPVVLALHESPRSSLSMLPVIEALADRYRVIAPDTPGYGLSDPLPVEAPGMDDFLDAIVSLLDSLGLDRVALYGAHTGAALATAFALREPRRVSALVLDGLSAFTEDEVAAFNARYLAPYAPAWDGAHVMGTWSRVKDLFTWFPWCDRSPSRRLGHEPPDLAALQRSALGFLQAGPHYAKAYSLAAAFQPNPALKALQAPATVIARPDDLIADHLDRLTPGDGWEIVWLGDDTGAWADAIGRGLTKGAAPDRAGPALAAALGSVFVPMGAGWLHAILAGPAEGRVRVLIPGLPGDPRALAERAGRTYPDDRLVVLSPPGCGWSDPLADAGQGLEGVLDALDAGLAALGLEPAGVMGQGASAILARLWARRRNWPFAAGHIDPPAWLSASASLPEGPLLSPLPPAWDGSHLTGAWFQLRDLQLYDTPPGAGPPVRRADADRFDLARFDRLFRFYVEGPDCAGLLERLIAHLRADPAARLAASGA